MTTLLWAGVSLSRMVVQGGLYLAGLPGWLAAARLGMGWPLTLGAVVVTVSVIRRAARLPEEPAAEIAEEILAGDAAHLIDHPASTDPDERPHDRRTPRPAAERRARPSTRNAPENRHRRRAIAQLRRQRSALRTASG